MARLAAVAEPFRGSFVGRESDIATIEATLVGGARLVTLLGPGGVGKTRLLHRLVQHLAGRHSSAIFVDLTSARSAGDVVSRVAAAVSGASLAAGATAAEASERVGRAIARRGHCLLALDNLEQLELAALPLIREWLGRADKLVVLATSRVTLGVTGEVVYRLAPLSLERDASGTTPALRLFEERARAVRASFAPAEVPIVERIVRLLEGMPLALEMAATRFAVLSPTELLERLGRPLAVLKSSGRSDPGRHASVALMLDGSWELLGPGERRALADLGVFVGGFSIEAAEAIVELDEGVLASLERLVESSLVRIVPSRTVRARHAPWEVVREYALERLTAESRLDTVRARHAAFFASWAEARLALMECGADAQTTRTDDAQIALAELVDEEANLAAAAAHVGTSNDPASHGLHLRLLCALEPVRMLRGQLDGLAREIDAALAKTSDSAWHSSGFSLLAARSHHALARAFHELGRPTEARIAYERAIAGAGDAGDPTLGGLARCGLGRVVAGLGEWEQARALFDEALSLPGAALRVKRFARACVEFYGTEIGTSTDPRGAVADYVDVCRRSADPRELAFWLVQLARVETELVRDRESAERHFDEALLLARSTGDLRGEGYALFGLGTHRVAHGPRIDSLRLLADAATTLREAGTRRYEAWALGFLGVAQALLADFANALVTLSEAIALVHAVGDAPREAHWRAYRGAVRARLDDVESAEEDIETARALAPAKSRYHGWTIDLCAAQVAVARARASGRRGDVVEGRRHVAQVEELLAQAGWASGDTREHRVWPWGTELFEPRIAAELLESALLDLVAPPGALRVAPDGAHFVLPSSERVVCPGRGKLQSLLVALAKARALRPGSAVGAADLVAAAWPGERMKREAGANRLHVTLGNLKKLGLRSVIVRGDGGWMLDPAVPFVWDGVMPVTERPPIKTDLKARTQARRRARW